MSAELLSQPVHWIDSDTLLERCCQKWADVPLIALDTEFIRSTTYYPIAGLLQVNDGDANYLIDPQAIDDWYPLIEILDSSERIVAMHACSEDLEVLQMELGCVPAKIFDTQIAAAFLGMPSSLGYAAAVKQILGVDVPKTETRSDWLQRPLSQPQKYYAALDVEYLIRLAHELLHQLDEKKRLEWVFEEGRRVYKNYKDLQNLNNSYARIKSAWKLQPRKLAVLMKLSRWRENYAQQNDIPRNRVLKEKALVELALRCPAHISKLRDIDGISERLIRREGQTIIDQISESLALEEKNLPAPLPKPLNKQEREMLQGLRESVRDFADELSISPEILLRKKESEALIRLKLADEWDSINDFFKGWRRVVFTEKLVNALRVL